MPPMPVHQDTVRRSSPTVDPSSQTATWASHNPDSSEKTLPESQASSADPPPQDPQPRPNGLTKRAENLPPKPSTTMTFLLQMLRLRNIILRPDASIDFTSPQRRSAAARIHQEAALGQTRGTVVNPPCTGCKRGFGPFTECVAIKGHFGGYCANCYYTNQELRCNLALGE